jgi:hypothetical protein
MGICRRPAVALKAAVAVHGPQQPVRGVIHDTESHDYAGIRDLQGIVDYWQRQALGYGAHIIIDKDGNSAYCARPDRITYAVARRNTDSVHIELVGFARFTKFLWFTRIKQLRECAKWMAWLNLEYDIPLRFGVNHGWSGHRHQPKQTHTDPGAFFPMGWVIRQANKYRKEGWA